MRIFRSVWQSPRRLLLLAVAVVLIVQAVFAVSSARTRGFASSDAGVKLWQVQSIVRTGQIDAPVAYPGAAYDPEHKYSPFVSPWFFWQDGQPYSEYTSPFLWVSAPLFAVLGHKGLLIIPWLSGALLVIMAAWLAWRVRPDRWAALAPIIVGFSSPLLIYSIEFWEHTAGVGLATFALVGIVKAIGSSRRAGWLIVAGAALGLGLTMRAELYVYPLAVAIGLLLLRPVLPLLRSLAFLAIGGLLTAGPWWLYQTLRWGSPLGPRVSQNVPLLGGNEMLTRLGDATGRNWSMLWPGAGSGLELLTGLLIVALLLAVALVVLRRTRWMRALAWLLVFVLVGMAGVLAWRLINWPNETGLRPDDLITTFPLILLLLLLGPVALIADKPPSILTRFLLTTALVFLLLVLLISPFQGGVQWGPRFLLPVIVPLAVAIVDLIARGWALSDRWWRAGLALAGSVLLLTGVLSTALGVQFIRDGQQGNAALQNLIASLPEHVVVTDGWFIPQGAPYTFDQKIWLLSENRPDMFQLLQYLRKQTNEPGIVYISSLTWAHMDPKVLMGARIAQNGDFQYFDWPGMYLQVGRYFLYK